MMPCLCQAQLASTVGFLMQDIQLYVLLSPLLFILIFMNLEMMLISSDLSSEPNIMIMGEVGFFTDPFFCEPFFIYVSRLSLFYCLVRSLQSGKGLTSRLFLCDVTLCFCHFPIWCLHVLDFIAS